MSGGGVIGTIAGAGAMVGVVAYVKLVWRQSGHVADNERKFRDAAEKARLARPMPPLIRCPRCSSTKIRRPTDFELSLTRRRDRGDAEFVCGECDKLF